MVILHPGGVLRRRYIEPRDLSLTAVADAMGVSLSSVSRVVNEKSEMTSDMALRFSYVLGGTPELWMNMQTRYNLAEAQKQIDTTKLKKLNANAGRFRETQEQEMVV